MLGKKSRDQGVSRSVGGVPEEITVKWFAAIGAELGDRKHESKGLGGAEARP